jgi:hypothetical protein
MTIALVLKDKEIVDIVVSSSFIKPWHLLTSQMTITFSRRLYCAVI